MTLTPEVLLRRLMIADATFLTTKEKCMLENAPESAESLAACSLAALSVLVGRTIGSRCSWNGGAVYKKAQIALHLIKALGIQYAFFDSADFPAMLREMSDPPYVIFYRGSLSCLQNHCVSVVGTRRATVGAKQAAVAFAKDAATAGCTVVSGLAYGIDVEAHKGALQAENGATAAVLASGIDTITPASHTRIARRILEQGGCIMSEYTPGTPAAAFRFIQRDRLIAALSPATVVVQAPSGSGALITANFALEYGRELLFHAAAFSEESQILMRNSVDNLHLQLAQGRNVSYKIENSSEKYVSDGAPIIHSFEEYCSYRAGLADTAVCKKDACQMQLF